MKCIEGVVCMQNMKNCTVFVVKEAWGTIGQRGTEEESVVWRYQPKLTASVLGVTCRHVGLADQVSTLLCVAHPQ